MRSHTPSCHPSRSTVTNSLGVSRLFSYTASGRMRQSCRPKSRSPDTTPSSVGASPCDGSCSLSVFCQTTLHAPVQPKKIRPKSLFQNILPASPLFSVFCTTNPSYLQQNKDWGGGGGGVLHARYFPKMEKASSPWRASLLTLAPKITMKTWT